MNLQNTNRLADLENELWLPGERMRGRDSWGVWDGHVHTLYLKWITNRDIVYSTGNSAQCYVVAWKGEEFQEEWILIYVWLSHFPVYLNHNIVHWLYPKTK